MRGDEEARIIDAQDEEIGRLRKLLGRILEEDNRIEALSDQLHVDISNEYNKR